MTWPGSPPCRIRLTGISSFLPVRVCGMAGAAMISSGTCRGEAASRMARRIVPASASYGVAERMPK
jgi:hypothetical protein